MTVHSITFCKAGRDDLEAIVALLADDALGQHREDPRLPLSEKYVQAFRAIEADENQLLGVAKHADEVARTMHITFIPGIARRGALRGQIEAVRIAKPYRGEGLGQRMFDWAIGQCRSRGCYLVQLTSDKSRSDAHHFYEKLGFMASHEGYKLIL